MQELIYLALGLSGLSLSINQESIALIKKAVDILISVGVGILKGDILSSSKYGIISFHHGDNSLVYEIIQFLGSIRGFRIYWIYNTKIN